MAPPLKRRRLFFWQEEAESDSSSTIQTHGFAHAVTDIDAVTPSATASAEPKVDLRQLLMANVRKRQDVQVDFAVQVASEQSVSTATPTSSATPQSSTILSSTETTSAAPASSISSSFVSATSTTPISTSTSLPLSTSFSSTPVSSPIITSSSSFAAFSASANSTLAGQSDIHGILAATDDRAENILASNLSSSSSTTSSSSASSGFFSYTNSSSSTTTLSSTSTDDSSSTENVAATTVLTTQTFSSDGQPVSTITSAIGVAGNGANPATPSQSAGLASNSGGGSDPPPAGTIAGGVVGGAAGLAILLLAAMLLLRWYRRRNQFGHTPVPQTLTPGYSDAEPTVSRGPGMAEQAGLRPWAAAVPALFRHQQTAAPATQERGFQRVSGRKLPSAWSPGMESTPPVPQRNYDRPLNNASENPFSDRPGSHSPEDMMDLGRQPSDEQMTVMPGAHRRPTIHDPQSPPFQGENNGNLWPRHTSAIARTSGGDFAGIPQQTIYDTFGDGRATNFREDI